MTNDPLQMTNRIFRSDEFGSRIEATLDRLQRICGKQAIGLKGRNICTVDFRRITRL